MKICRVCSKPEGEVQFSKNKNTKDGLQSKCKECWKKYTKEYYAKNKEIKKEKAMDWYHANNAKAKAIRLKWRVENKEHYIDITRKYYNKNKDKIMSRSAEWNIENKEKHAVHMKTYASSEKGKANKLNWSLQNPDKMRLYKHNYKAKRKQWEDSGWSITSSWWADLLKRYNSKCAYCGVDNSVAPKYYKQGKPVSYGLTPDHIRPLSKGGLHIADNIVPACMKCQGSKQSKSIEEFGISPRTW